MTNFTTDYMGFKPSKYPAHLLPDNMTWPETWISSQLAVICGICYLVLAVMGLFGNLWVIRVLGTVLFSSAQRFSPYRAGYILILCMSVVDIMVICGLPMAVSDMLTVCYNFAETQKNKLDKP